MGQSESLRVCESLTTSLGPTLSDMRMERMRREQKQITFSAGLLTASLPPRWRVDGERTMEKQREKGGHAQDAGLTQPGSYLYVAVESRNAAREKICGRGPTA